MVYGENGILEFEYKPFNVFCKSDVQMYEVAVPHDIIKIRILNAYKHVKTATRIFTNSPA